MNAAAGVYVPPTPDTILTPVEEEGRDGLSCILRPNVSLAPHVRFNMEDPNPPTEILAIILDYPLYILFLFLWIKRELGGNIQIYKMGESA